jgi:hypothetical protein
MRAALAWLAPSPRVPKASAAAIIHFFMLPIIPPFQPGQFLSTRFGFRPSGSFGPAASRPAGYVLIEQRLRLKVALCAAKYSSATFSLNGVYGV